MYDNGKAYEQGMQKMQQTVYDYFVIRLIAFCKELFQSADTAREYHNLTGNTFTSYACGIYKDGALFEVLFSADYKKDPIRVKLKKGEVFTGISYDGADVKGFKADVNTDQGFGKDTSARFLRNYNPTVKKGFEVVMCTGTEYSNFLEKVKGLNVLTDTFLYSKALFMQNLKKI
jgi:hypothetical protein